MTDVLYFKVAGLTFGIKLDEELGLRDRLEAYKPFACGKADELLFMLPIDKDDAENPFDEDGWELLVDEDFEGVITEVYLADGKVYHFIFKLAIDSRVWACVDFNRDLTQMSCRIHGGVDFQLLSLNSVLMLVFALSSSSKDLLLFHASVIKHEGKGYLFLGKSGTGKSTHSQLWQQYIPGSELLNDDNPAVRMIQGEPWVFGTPWSGKTPCYKNEQVPVGGFVRLWQSPENSIKRLPVFEAYAAILPTVTNMKWERRFADAVNNTIMALIQKVPAFSLRNRPDKEAALMSFNALKQADGER